MIRERVRSLLFEREVVSLMGVNFLIKPVGLVSQMLMARWFGAGEALDAYGLAFFLVTLGDGAIARTFKAAMAPHLIRMKRELDVSAFHHYQNGVLALFYGPGAAWLLLLTMAAPLMVGLVGPDLPEVTRRLAVRMIAVLAVPALLLVANSLVMAVLQLHRDFRLAGIMPGIQSVAMLLGLVMWHDSLGIWALPAGFALGQVLQGPLLIWRVQKIGAARMAPPAGVRGDLPLLRMLAGAVLLAELMLTVNMFLDRWFATGLEPGSISSLNYAWTLTNFGMTLFLTSLVTVMFPRMSEFIAAGDLESCNTYVSGNLVKVSNLVVPASCAAALAAPEIVRVLFERGAFDAADAARTAGTMSMYLLGLPALIINAVVARIFHSLQLLRDKVWLALQYLVTNLALNALLVSPLQVRGLALASSLAIITHLGCSLWLLHHRRSGLDSGRFLRVVGGAYAAGIVAIVGSWLLVNRLGIDGAARGSVGESLGAGSLKVVSVVAIYLVVIVVGRRLGVGPERRGS